MYLEKNLQQYLDDLASAQPTPGGGSTAALSGAMGAALASMVCRFTLGKESYASVHQEVEELLRKAEFLRLRFQQLIQEDIEAYGRLSASYKLPRQTNKESIARSASIQKHLFAAAIVPLEVAECAAEIMNCCKRIAQIGNTTVISDVAAGAIQASSAGESAALLVLVNLRAMKDDELIADLRDRLSMALAIIREGMQQVTIIMGGTE